MNRSEIKELAKQKIKGNLWNILWPMLIIEVINSILSSFFGPSIDLTQIKEMGEMYKRLYKKLYIKSRIRR